MAQQGNPFSPMVQAQVSIAVTAASQDLTLTSTGALGEGSVRLTNDGTDKIFWKYGSGGATVAGSVPMLPNTTEVFDLPASVTVIAVIGATGGLSTLRAVPGIGS
jgi:hypothetical protein